MASNDLTATSRPIKAAPAPNNFVARPKADVGTFPDGFFDLEDLLNLTNSHF